LIKTDFHLVLEFKLGLKVIADPGTKGFDFFAPQPRNGSLDFLDCAQGGK
jgi:hypothetical protein